MNRIDNQDIFDRAYARLAEKGTCDGAGGAEYTRVRREWEAMGRPAGVEHFIAVRANVPARGEGRELMN